jgi:hypothetical protein
MKKLLIAKPDEKLMATVFWSWEDIFLTDFMTQ